MENSERTKKVTEILEEVKEEIFEGVEEETRNSIMDRFIYMLLTK